VLLYAPTFPWREKWKNPKKQGKNFFSQLKQKNHAGGEFSSAT
jgi:hypothetical protein